MDLSKVNDNLSLRLQEDRKKKFQQGNGAEFLKSGNGWQEKRKALQEKFREELADKEKELGEYSERT